MATDTLVVDVMSDRLTAGVLPATGRLRPSGAEHNDPPALTVGDLWAALAPLDEILAERSIEADDVDRCLNSAAQVLRQHRPVLLAVLFSPGLVVERTRECSAVGGATDSVWAKVCWVTEAAWRAVGGPEPGAAYAPGDLALLRPVAARQRFLVLTEPFRHDPEGWPINVEVGDDGLPAVVFGSNTGHVYLARCREARSAWLRFLDEYQSHPMLAAASAREFEQELEQVVFRCPESRGRHHWRLGRPLVLDWEARRRPRMAPTNSDVAAMADVAERHLLPRFRLTRVARLATFAAGTTVVTSVGAVVMAVAALGAVVLAGSGRFIAATWVAVAAALLLGGQVVWFGRLWAAQWMLRLPAAAAVGLVLLVAFAPTWWQLPVLDWPAPAVLVGASLAYLVVEARNHGVNPLAALGRATAVTIAGSAYALLIALIGLVAVAPAFSENSFVPLDEGGGYTLVQLWNSVDLVPEARSVLVLAGAWCLAVGVFSQILWDDRPITAPLAHMRWRKEREA